MYEYKFDIYASLCLLRHPAESLIITGEGFCHNFRSSSCNKQRVVLGLSLLSRANSSNQDNMKATTVENNAGNQRSGDNLLSLRRDAIATSTTPVLQEEVARSLLLSQALTARTNNVDDALIDGPNPWSSLTLLSSDLLNYTNASVQRPPPRGSLSNMSGRVDDEAMRQNLVSVIQQAMRIIDDGATGGSQNDEI